MERPLGRELSVKGVTRVFEGIRAVSKVDMSIRAESITALIGPNGAGKTTLMNLISGFEALNQGSITLDALELSGLSSAERARIGIRRTFQHLQLADDLTAIENVALGLFDSVGLNVFELVVDHLPSRKRKHEEMAEAAWGALELFGISDVANTETGTLPLGVQRRIELARAVVARPSMLLLDEPAAGLAPSDRLQLKAVLRMLAGSGVGILLVEHDVDLVFSVANYVYVLDHGEIIAHGEPQDVRADEKVIKAYLGEATTDA